MPRSESQFSASLNAFMDDLVQTGAGYEMVCSQAESDGLDHEVRKIKEQIRVLIRKHCVRRNRVSVYDRLRRQRG